MAIVHFKGQIRPFALCQSFTAAERHVRIVELVTCDKCIVLMKKMNLLPACSKCGGWHE